MKPSGVRWHSPSSAAGSVGNSCVSAHLLASALATLVTPARLQHHLVLHWLTSLQLSFSSLSTLYPSSIPTAFLAAKFSTSGEPLTAHWRGQIELTQPVRTVCVCVASALRTTESEDNGSCSSLNPLYNIGPPLIDITITITIIISFTVGQTESPLSAQAE